MPLPMSTIADDRNAALGSVMSAPLTAPICTNRIGTASAPALAAGDDEPLGALPPEIVEHDIDPLREFPAEELLELRLVVDKGDRDIGAKVRHGFQRLDIAPGGDDLFGPEVIGDLHGEAPRGARRSIDEDGLAGLEARALLKRRPRRHAGIGDRRSRHIVKLVGQSKAARRRRDGAFAMLP